MKAIKTGPPVAWIRASAMLYPKERRPYEDPLAEQMLSPIYKGMLFLMRSPALRDLILGVRNKKRSGLIGMHLCRYNYIDQVLQEALARHKIKAVVNLGAGMDCRAFFIPGLETLPYFEVDHPSLIKMKKKKIQKIFGNIPANVSYVPVDLEKDDLQFCLTEAGYRFSERTFFIWEGVSAYLSERANEIILTTMAKAPAGSRVVFSYMIQSFLDGKDLTEELQKVYRYNLKQNLYIFGLDPANIKEYLSRFSLRLTEDIGSKEMRERYPRVTQLGFEVAELERIALAEVRG